MVGVIIENSLTNKDFLDRISVTRTWQDEDWILHEVQVTEAEAKELAKHLTDGPWYSHFWEPEEDAILVVFKDKVFHIKHSDKATWQEAIVHGLSIGIPLEQLDFPIS